MNAAASVQLQSVTKRFGEVTAVGDISLEVLDGEFFSLLGPSGCGKTTTLRMIGGFELPSEGEIYLGGEAQGTRPPHQRPVNTVFQNYALFPHMTVYQNVAFGLEMRRLPKEGIPSAVASALEMVQLTGFEGRRPKQLSGGQQQRVALARALINRPRVLLLDEPLGALDLKLRKAMQLELKELQNRVGITFIYVTHDQEEALTMSDRIAVMNQGHVLQVGTPPEIYNRPVGRFVADFIGETNFLPAKVLGAQPPVVELELESGDPARATALEALPTGAWVTLAIRPERMFIGQAVMGADWNRLAAEVVEIIYTGATTSYQLRQASGTRFRVRRPNDDSDRSNQLTIGDQVEVSWRFETGSVFQEAPAPEQQD